MQEKDNFFAFLLRFSTKPYSPERARSKRVTRSVQTAFELRADDERGRINKIYKRSVLQVNKENVLQAIGRSTGLICEISARKGTPIGRPLASKL